jgi:hypothetical protein
MVLRPPIESTAETGQVKIATSEVERLENVEPTNQDLEPNRDKFELLNET